MTERAPERTSGRDAAAGSRAPERILALAGVTGLLAVAVVSLVLVLGAVGGDGEQDVASAPTATPTPEATPTPKPEPTPVPLTPAQRRQRAAAAEIVESRGFEVVRLRDYDPRKTLRVLIGRQTGGEGRLAFFFVDGDYIGNDATDTSARLKVMRNRDLQVTLGYGTYAPGDEPGKPTGGPVKVRFRWDGTRLAPQDPIPPVEQRSPGYAG